MSDYEERRKMIAKFRTETGREPSDAEWLEIYSAVRMGRKTWKWC